MDLIDRLSELKTRISRQKASVGTEEAAKTAFVLPFIQLLGYDIFDPSEVVPELTADHGVKKGEKVDYAIKQDDQVVILIECKSIGAKLEAKHAGQLYRYFSVTDARFAVLTDGIRYVFFTDLEKPNTMDQRPFFEFDVLDHRDEDVEELKKFARHSFDLDTILDTATNLKYHKALLANSSAGIDDERSDASPSDVDNAGGTDANGIETTPEEWEGFRIVQAISQYLDNVEMDAPTDGNGTTMFDVASTA